MRASDGKKKLDKHQDSSDSYRYGSGLLGLLPFALSARGTPILWSHDLGDPRAGNSPVDVPSPGGTRAGLRAGVSVFSADGQHAGLVVEVYVDLLRLHAGGVGIHLKAVLSLANVLRGQAVSGRQ